MPSDLLMCLVCCHRSPGTANVKVCPKAAAEQELVLVCEEHIEDGEAEGDAAAAICKAQVGWQAGQSSRYTFAWFICLFLLGTEHGCPFHVWFAISSAVGLRVP